VAEQSFMRTSEESMAKAKGSWEAEREPSNVERDESTGHKMPPSVTNPPH
jgi:hypothetical protein